MDQTVHTSWSLSSVFWKRGPPWTLTQDGCEDQVRKPTGAWAAVCGTADTLSGALGRRPAGAVWVCLGHPYL